jgi:predicted transcriptional regulator
MKMVVGPTPCELAVRVVIPSLRALVAKELTRTYSLKQQEIASALGVTQSAVSQYVRSVRGKTLDLDGIAPIDRIVKETAESISKNNVSTAYINSTVKHVG